MALSIFTYNLSSCVLFTTATREREGTRGLSLNSEGNVPVWKVPYGHFRNA